MGMLRCEKLGASACHSVSGFPWTTSGHTHDLGAQQNCHSNHREHGRACEKRRPHRRVNDWSCVLLESELASLDSRSVTRLASK
eukprot:11204967-Lingulodinium_polyedra.AAC.2